MSTHNIICLILLLLVYVGLCKQPNIFFIIVDDLGYAEVGFNRQQVDTEVTTPNIDQLAIKEGLILGRHYVHYTCTPTRSSFQSGRYPVHVQLTLADPDNPSSGIPRNMTCLGNKLQSAGYSTHMVGKWDCGMASPQHTPLFRGYNSSFFYFEHENDYWTQNIMNTNCLHISGYSDLKDLWMSNNTYNNPAYKYQGTNYEEYLFEDEIYKQINYVSSLNDTIPWFILYTPHIAHMPLQLPQNIYNEYNFNNDENLCFDYANQQNAGYIYPNQTWNGSTGYRCRSQYHGMVYILDNIIGNISYLLKLNNLWNNTLFVFSTDNGGSLWLESNAGNNYPMKGGKFSPWEGGIRGAAFVSGGYLPKNRVGQKEMGLIHICDWYYTFCELNNISPLDPNSQIYNLPNVDGMNIWPLISGYNTTSPRTEIPVDYNTLINEPYKLLISSSVSYSGWTGIQFPNASSPQNDVKQIQQDCSHGCLYDISSDWTEQKDISSNNQNIVNKLKNRLNELSKGFYSNNETGINSCPSNITVECACWMAKNKYNGFIGPWQYLD